MAETHLDPIAPTPEQVLTFKRLGYNAGEIADLLHVSPHKVRRLLTEANRTTLAEAAKDFVHAQLLPKVLANLDAALNKDEGAEISLKLADKLGILDASAPSGPPAEADSTSTFEEYRLSILRRRSNKVPLDTPGRTPNIIDAEIAPAIALPSPERSGDRNEETSPESD